MKYRHLITLLFVLSSVFSTLQADYQPRIDALNSNNGLSHNTVRCMLQDKTGYIWLGSLNGLNRYDGVRIKTYIPNAENQATLSSGKIKELFQDSYGHIWVRTYSDMFHCYAPMIDGFMNTYETNKSIRKTKHDLYYQDNNRNIWLGSMNDGCVKITFGEKTMSCNIFSKKLLGNLVSDAVRDIFQDSKSNVWVLTDGGISKIYTDNKSYPVVKDKQGWMKACEIKNQVFFVSKSGKLLSFNSRNNKYSLVAALPNGLVVNQVSCFNDQKIFISSTNGVFEYSPTSKVLKNANYLFGEAITGNCSHKKDNAGNIWFFNMTGNVWLINAKNNKTDKINLIPYSTIQLIDEERYQFAVDKRNNVWISTYGNGLFCYNLTNATISHFNYGKNNSGLTSNYLLSVMADKNNNIWVGTESMGVNKLSFNSNNVQIHFPAPENPIRNGNIIKAFLEDRKGNIWVASKSGSLFQYDATLKNKTVIQENGLNVYNFYEEKNGTIWLATKRNGIVELPDGKFGNARYYTQNGKTGCLSNNNTFSVLRDRKGRLWVATFGGGVCVKLSNQGTEGFRSFFSDDIWIKYTRHLLLDRKGDMWVATSYGVLRFNPDQLLANPRAYKHYNFDVDSKNCLSNPEVRQIYEDTHGDIWLATAGGGLNRFVGENESGNGIFEVFKNKEGLAADNIMSIQQDRADNLWLGTENGLHRFNLQSKSFQYFKFSDDFSANIYSETAIAQCRNGRMLCGSLNGFYSFFPNQLIANVKENNKVYLTGFNVFDEPAKVGTSNAPLKKSITFADEIILKSNDKTFHIEFSNLNFHDPRANQFMYILENYERRWNLSGSLSSATYRNVPPGHYTFKVKTMTPDGIWDDEHATTIQIIIRPPFWASGWAIFLYVIIFFILAYVGYNLFVKFYRLNNAVKVERQLTDYKLRFFTNISHEFRTPLTLIKGSVDTLNDIKNKMSPGLQNIVDDLDKNTGHLMRLIDQLMEFRKLQNNKQKLNLQLTDVVGFLRDIFNSFGNVAIKSNIDYNFVSHCEKLELYIDRNKADKIVFNLLSNAFKFTQRGGKITLTTELNESKNSIRISVYDNGLGIPKEKQNMLFSRFMQINFSSNGTGVGLSLVNEFTLLHKGTVDFHENQGGGSVFSIELPLNADVYTSDEFVKDQISTQHENKNELIKINEFIEDENSNNMLNLLTHEPVAGSKYKILVIDDNDGIRDFLTIKLSPFFEVITAEDGTIGIKRSMEEDPDLIICDVMMPGMNGFELTKKLKDDFATCHIPVILLTAYISDEHNTEGIEAGADAYISKPFSMSHLMLQINKLIEKRELLHKHYAGNSLVTATINEEENTDDNSPVSELHGRDGQFLKLIEELLEKHLSNPEFNVDEFAQLANTGRTLFFKKIKYLTGYSPNEFIRFRRMTKAAELLKTYKYNVSEVSYMVGINDPFYFSKCFKAQFGCSPSKYINQQ